MNQTKKVDTRRIDAWSSWLLILLAIGSFVLSYAAMYQLAVDSDLGMLAILWPAITESAVVIFSLGMLRARLHGYKNQWVWFLILICTALSVVFNVTHAPIVEGQHWAITAAVYALPPIFLFLSFKLLLWQIEKDNERTNAVDTLDNLKEQVVKLSTELDQKQVEAKKEIDNQRQLMTWELQHRLELQRAELSRLHKLATDEVDTIKQEVDRLSTKRDRLISELDNLSTELDSLKIERRQLADGGKPDGANISQSTIDAARDVLRQNLVNGSLNISGAELGRLLNVSRTTGNNLKKMLLSEFTNGHSNGNGSH